MKRAVIYIRVSSEKQAEGVSPEAQEADCRALCQRQGYQVAEVYRDTEKYRVRGRLVEPSGTRSDRPQFLRMLAESDAGKFDVLVAWREDRLYRGVNRAVIDLKERVKAGLFNIEIVNGGFNLQTMEVLAWAAGVENEARGERRNMGMGRRFAAGKLLLSNPIYGYDYNRELGTLTVNELHSPWVVQIWKWYGEGVGRYEIRRRLVAADAPQTERMKRRRKHSWSLTLIDTILHRDEYYTGIINPTFDGRTYEAKIPTLIDEETYQAVLARRAAWKAWPAGNLKSNGLVAGLLYCAACGRQMYLTSRLAPLRNGEATRYVYYICHGYNRQTAGKDCAKYMNQKHVDAEAWQRVWAWFSEPERFEQSLQARMSQLRIEESDAEASIASLERQLDDTLLERQRVIGFARKALISEDDLETQLLALGMQERGIRQALAEKRLLTGNRAGKLLELAQLYREQVQGGFADINTHPETDEQAAEQFEFRRNIMHALVQRVHVREDKSITIDVVFDPPSLLINNVASGVH